jgi:quercetin dioxygenase-like cupin family protein
MATITGRTLDADGHPVPGTGFEVEPGSALADRLADRVGPVRSHPTRPVWSTPLPAPDGTMRLLSVFGAGYEGPPEHYHRLGPERFEVLAGEPVFSIDGRERRAEPGETVTIEPGRTHTFRFEDGPNHLLIEVEPAGRLRDVFATLGGLAHDGAADPDDPLQRAIIADRLSRHTVFTDPDPRIGRPVAELLSPVARLRGYQGAYGKYRQPAFWEAHVEQPEF